MWQERLFAVAHYADQGVLVLLLCLTVLSVGIIFERYNALRKHAELSRQHQKTVRQALKDRNLGVIRQMAKDETSIEGRALSFAIESIRKGETSHLPEVFNTFSMTEKPILERNLGFLATVGSNAPYIGLFGTVLGIMKAFHEMSKATDAGQNTVMGGISAALIATAAGLLAAIPAVLAYNYFQRQVKAIMGSLNSCRELAIAYAKEKGE